MPGVFSQQQCTVQHCMFTPDSNGLVSIPTTTLSIPGCAFYQCETLKSLIIPAEVKTIGLYAFKDNSNLISVSVLCGSLLLLNNEQFSGSTLLTSCTISAPSSVTLPNPQYQPTFQSISTTPCCLINPGDGGIVNIPNSVKAIPSGSFASCQGLTRVNAGSSVLSIGERAFAYCSSLVTVSFSSPGLLSIGMNAFMHSSLASFHVPSSVVNISSQAFSSTYSLKSLTFQSGSSLTAILDYAFSGTGLTNITIPASVKSIGQSAFGSSALQSLYFAPGSNLTFIARTAFSQAPLTYISFPSSSNVVRIESSAFYTSDSSVAPLVINAACGSAVALQNYAFQNVNGVTANAPASFRLDVNVDQGPDPLINVVTKRCCWITPDAQGKVVIPVNTLNIPNGAFASCSALKTVELPLNLQSIGFGAFAGTGLTSLFIGPSVKSIEGYAFSNVNGLQSVVIHPRVDIGEYAFANITTLNSVLFTCDDSPMLGANVAHTAFYGSVNAVVAAIGGRGISPPDPFDYGASPANYPHFTYSCCGGEPLLPATDYNGPYCCGYCNQPPGSLFVSGGGASGSATVPVVVSIVVIALIAGGAYWYYTQKKAAAMSAAAAASGEGVQGTKSANIDIENIYADSSGTAANPMQQQAPVKAPVGAPRAPPAPPSGMQRGAPPPGRAAPPAPPRP